MSNVTVQNIEWFKNIMWKVITKAVREETDKGLNELKGGVSNGVFRQPVVA